MTGRRAAFKVARKNALRNRRRTVFLVLIVAVPVAFGVVFAGVIRASSLTSEERAQTNLGAAEVRIRVHGPEEVTGWVVSNVDRISPDTTITEFKTAAIRVSGIGYAQVTDIDITEPAAEGLLLIVGGDRPVAEGEVAISPSLSNEMGVGVGDTVEFEGLPLGKLKIVGLVSQPFSSTSSDILVHHGGLDPLGSDPSDGAVTNLLLDGPSGERAVVELQDLWYSEGQASFLPEPALSPKPAELEFIDDQTYALLTAAEIDELVGLVQETVQAGGDPTSVGYSLVNQIVYGSGRYQDIPEIDVETRTTWLNQGSIEDKPGLVATGAAALLLVEVAFITGAAFAAGTRRRLREIGLLGANGASERHVRATVVGEAFTIATAGAAGGVLLGVGVMILARPLVQRFVDRVIVGVGVSFTDMIGPVAVALISVVVAVLIPARTASQVPTTTALQGRMPTAPPRKRVVPVGTGAALAGMLMISVSLTSNSNYANVLVGLGGVLVVGGVAMLSSPILAGVSKLADHVPATSRLVLRDSGRNRTRSAVAVAAIMVILLAPVTIMTTTASDARRALAFGLPSPGNHLLLTGSYPVSGFGDADPITESDVATVAAVVPESQVAVFDTLDLRVITSALLDLAASDDPQFVSQGISNGFPAAIGTDDLVRALGDPGVKRSIESDEIVVLGIEDRQTRVSLNGVEYPAHEYPVPVLRWDMPRVLLPESKTADFSEANTRPMALFILEGPLSQDEQNQLSELFLQVSGGHREITDSTLYLIMGAATLLIVLIVVSLVTAVSAAEVDHEIRTIVAVGAPGSIRRRFLALLTGYQTSVAMLLAVPLGVGLVWVFTSAQDYIDTGPFGAVRGTAVTVPVVQIGIFALTLPLIITLLTLLSVRSAPVTPPRRAT